MTGPIQIVPFEAQHGSAFYSLNRRWLDEHGLFEPHDEAQLADPGGEILSEGGAIFVALRGRDVVGTAAVIPHGPWEVELAKLAVTESERGAGLGRRLVERCLDHVNESGVARVVLVSSSKLGAALRLYESMGFVHRPLPSELPYATADVYMELDLTGSTKPLPAAHNATPSRA